MKGHPATSIAYISTCTVTGITLSGPPNVLDDLLASGYLPKTSSLKIPIYAPYHAPHLYSSRDIDVILQYTSNAEFSGYRQWTPIASSTDQQWLNDATFGKLIPHVLEEILLHPLRLDQILVAVAEDYGSSLYDIAHCYFGQPELCHSLEETWLVQRGY